LAQNERKRQEALAKKRSKREQRKRAEKPALLGSQSAAAVGRWPVHSAWILSDWREKLLAVMFIIRQQTNGAYALGSYLVDLGCLGLKNTFAAMNLTWKDVQEKMQPPARSGSHIVQCDPNLVAKILLTGVEFAEQLGFFPHKDFRDSISMLQGLDPDACQEHVSTGKNGKPFYVQGPYDDTARILKRLEAAVGRDGFEFMYGLGGFAEYTGDEDDYDVDEEDEDSLEPPRW